ncbi:MAG: hypothetical protein ACK53L_25550, partial [Pirellulaceae bacterium]
DQLLVALAALELAHRQEAEALLQGGVGPLVAAPGPQVGGAVPLVMEHGGWKTPAVMYGYVAASLQRSLKVSRALFSL